MLPKITSLTIQTSKDKLFLLDEAAIYVRDVKDFEMKVREVSHNLGVAPEWLMAVIHSESKFDASVTNFKGSGATGLIQLMPKTAKDYRITVEQLRNLNHVQQLDYIYHYLNGVRKSRKTQFNSLTELYLAILYPRALEAHNKTPHYTLYAHPSISYKMNSGLDENKDNRVTVSDIDARMKRKYFAAYNAYHNIGSQRGFTSVAGLGSSDQLLQYLLIGLALIIIVLQLSGNAKSTRF